MIEQFTPMKKDEAPSCPRNEGVVCWVWQRHCNTCGWNPDVAKDRLQKFCAKMGIPMPEAPDKI